MGAVRSKRNGLPGQTGNEQVFQIHSVQRVVYRQDEHLATACYNSQHFLLTTPEAAQEIRCLPILHTVPLHPHTHAVFICKHTHTSASMIYCLITFLKHDYPLRPVPSVSTMSLEHQEYSVLT